LSFSAENECYDQHPLRGFLGLGQVCYGHERIHVHGHVPRSTNRQPAS